MATIRKTTETGLSLYLHPIWANLLLVYDAMTEEDEEDEKLQTKCGTRLALLVDRLHIAMKSLRAINNLI